MLRVPPACGRDAAPLLGLVLRRQHNVRRRREQRRAVDVGVAVVDPDGARIGVLHADLDALLRPRVKGEHGRAAGRADQAAGRQQGDAPRLCHGCGRTIEENWGVGRLVG